jgi:hypothetical protein
VRSGAYDVRVAVQGPVFSSAMPIGASLDVK